MILVRNFEDLFYTLMERFDAYIWDYGYFYVGVREVSKDGAIIEITPENKLGYKEIMGFYEAEDFLLDELEALKKNGASQEEIEEKYEEIVDTYMDYLVEELGMFWNNFVN